MTMRTAGIIAVGLLIGIGAGSLLLFPDRDPGDDLEAVPAVAVIDEVSAKAPVADGAVTLPFKPPLDVPLRYAWTFESRWANGRQQKIKSTDQLIFAQRPGGGYTLRWTAGDFSVEAPEAERVALLATLAPIQGRTMVIEISPAGEVTGIANLAEIRALTEKAYAGAIALGDARYPDAPPEFRRMIQQMMRDLLARQRKMSDAQVREQILGNARDLLDQPGPLKPGVPRAGKLARPSDVDGSTVHYTTQTILQSYEPGRSAEILLVGQAADADATRVVRNLVQPALAAVADRQKRAQMQADLDALPDSSMSLQITRTIDLPSGLPSQTSRISRLMIPGGDEATDVSTYRRVQ